MAPLSNSEVSLAGMFMPYTDPPPKPSNLPSAEFSRSPNSPDTNEPTPQTLTAAKRLKSHAAQGPNHHVLPSTKALRDETRSDGEEAHGTVIPYEPSAVSRNSLDRQR